MTIAARSVVTRMEGRIVELLCGEVWAWMMPKESWRLTLLYLFQLHVTFTPAKPFGTHPDQTGNSRL
jgi:hypothetical protein